MSVEPGSERRIDLLVLVVDDIGCDIVKEARDCV